MPKTCGVYLITAPGLVYVGSSRNCEQRWKQHKTELLAQRHRYTAQLLEYLQSGTLGFEVVEACRHEERFSLEQQWMDKYPHRINIHRHVHSTGIDWTQEARQHLSSSRLGTRLPQATRRKMSDQRSGIKQSQTTIERRRQKLVGQKLTPEHKVTLSNARKGKPVSEAQLERLRSMAGNRKRSNSKQGASDNAGN